MSGFLTLDMGNSGLKAAIFIEDQITGRERFGMSSAIESIANLLENYRPEGISACSVVPGWTCAFMDEMNRRGIRDFLMVQPGIEYPFTVRVENPSAVGSDRLCAASGAVSLGIEEAVIVDVGTAVTVDVLSLSGFEGGAIFPGRDALIRSLRDSTAALPRLEWQGDRFSLPGKSTSKAIRAGICLGLAGAVSGLVKSSMDWFESAPPVLITGGGAGTLEEYLEFPFLRCPDLVFRGLHLLYITR